MRRAINPASVYACLQRTLECSTSSVQGASGSASSLVHTASAHRLSYGSQPVDEVLRRGRVLGSFSKHHLMPFMLQAHGQSRALFVQTQTTPNPQSLMFLPGRTVMEGGSKDFSNARAAEASPLASRLFQIDGVTGVFFGSEFVTVTKQADVSWSELSPKVSAAITDHFAAGEPLMAEVEGQGATDGEEDHEVVAMIKELLETRIRPAVQEDGGDIIFKGFDHDTGVVSVKMMGACSGCPSSTITLKSGIENMLMHYIPEVKGVLEDTEPEEYENEGAKVFAELESKIGER